MDNKRIQLLQDKATSLAKAKQRDFRRKLQDIIDEELIEGGKFSRILSELEGKDYLEVIFRILPYAYSKAPEDKGTTEENKTVEMTVVRERLSAKCADEGQ